MNEPVKKAYSLPRLSKMELPVPAAKCEVNPVFCVTPLVHLFTFKNKNFFDTGAGDGSSQFQRSASDLELMAD